MNWRRFGRIMFFLALLKLSTGCEVFEPGQGVFSGFGCTLQVTSGRGCILYRTKRDKPTPYNSRGEEHIVQSTLLVPDSKTIEVKPTPIIQPEKEEEPNPFAASDNLGMKSASGIDTRSMGEPGQKPSSSSTSESPHEHSHPE